MPWTLGSQHQLRYPNSSVPRAGPDAADSSEMMSQAHPAIRDVLIAAKALQCLCSIPGRQHLGSKTNKSPSSLSETCGRAGQLRAEPGTLQEDPAVPQADPSSCPRTSGRNLPLRSVCRHHSASESQGTHPQGHQTQLRHQQQLQPRQNPSFLCLCGSTRRSETPK